MAGVGRSFGAREELMIALAGKGARRKIPRSARRVGVNDIEEPGAAETAAQPSSPGEPAATVWLAPVVGLAVAWGTLLLLLKICAPYGGHIGQLPQWIAAMLVPPSSALGAAAAASMCGKRNAWTWTVYLLGGLVYLVLSVLKSSGEPDGDSGLNMAQLLLPLLHVLVSFVILEMTPRLRSLGLRLGLAAALLAVGLSAASFVAGKATLTGAPPESMKRSLGEAFEKQALGPLLASPTTVTWSEATTKLDGPAVAVGRYRINGALSDDRGVIRLSGIDPTTVHYAVTLNTKSGFADPMQENLKAKLARVRQYLKECGASEAVIGGLGEHGVRGFQRWTSHPDLAGEGELFITPGDRTVILEGIVQFDAALKMMKN